MSADDGTVTGIELPDARAPGALSAAISNATVGLVRDYTGRGPTKVRTTIRDNVVLVMLEDTLTKGEQSLVQTGNVEKVLDLRHAFQTAMRESAILAVESIVGVKVTAMMSANHVQPDLGAEIFVLETPLRTPDST